MSRDYVPLWCKSNYSFLEGASHPEELIETGSQHGLSTIGITDRNGVYGVVDAHAKAREHGMRLILGSEVTLEDRSTLVLLAQDREGWRQLCRLLTLGRLRSPKGECTLRWEEIYQHAEGLIALWGGHNSLLVHAADPVFVVQDLREAFSDRLYAMVARHRQASERPQEARLRRRAERYKLPLVASTEVLYHKRARRELQDVLTCIRHGVKLSEAGDRTHPNAEHDLKTPHNFSELFQDLPAAIDATVEIASRCNFSLDRLRYVYPSERLPDGQSSSSWMRELTWLGAQGRYGGEPSDAVKRQLNKELDLIDELEYCGYFLTMWEIVRFCREQRILCQGRGSAANSAVCYCLGITAVDPVGMGLLFERFLSRERAEPPDIDLDIEHERREEVIQHVYTKYGRKHAAMVCNFIRYRSRSALRDVGKVLGIAETALDRFSKLLSHYSSDFNAETMAQVGLDTEHPTHQHLLRLAGEIVDFPRHLSIHPGGFLLGHEPVHDIVPIENGTMEERTVIQWDKDCLEELGLFKVDLLGLGALHQLHLGFDLIEQHHGERWTMATLPQDDSATYDMLCRGDTVGVFQIESRAQMAMLPRLKPRKYYDLVIEVSIVRPGPITGGMVHPYLRRRSGEEPIEYPHPSLEPVLKRTLGVPLFQEQVIRLAVVAADYTPGEADQLRRDMAAWRRSGKIERHRQRLVRRMTEKGIAAEFAERVFEQIRGFGEYGFPESHAASFALIAYATAWMKRHRHDAFTCALLNAQPMGFYSSSTIVEDAKRHQVDVRPIDISCSDWQCRLEPTESGPYAIRMGLRYVKGLASRQGERIVAERQLQPFESIEQFVRRTQIDEGSATKLAESGALASFEKDRRAALWRVRGELKGQEPTLRVAERERQPSFASLGSQESINWDYRTSGHSTAGHPLAPLRERLRSMKLPSAEELTQMRHGKRLRYAGIVICRQRPGTASGVLFMTLEDESGFVNLVVWDRVYQEHQLLIKTTSFIGVTGKLQAQDGVTHLIADALWLPRLSVEVASGGSHDFR